MTQLLIHAFSRFYITHVVVKQKTKTNNDPRPATQLVFVSTRIPMDLNRDLNRACERSGLKKQAVIANGIRKIIPSLLRRATTGAVA